MIVYNYNGPHHTRGPFVTILLSISLLMVGIQMITSGIIRTGAYAAPKTINSMA
jgi:hypothetical protein